MNISIRAVLVRSRPVQEEGSIDDLAERCRQSTPMAIDEQSWRPESPFTELEEGERLLMPELELGFDEQEIARPMVTSRLQLGASAPAARVYAKVTARTQGVIAGDSTARGHEHWIAGTGFDYEVVSPRDVATGSLREAPAPAGDTDGAVERRFA